MIRQNAIVNVTVSWREVSTTETIVFSPGGAKERLYRIPTDNISLHDKVLIHITPVSGAIPPDDAIVNFNTTIIPGEYGIGSNSSWLHFSKPVSFCVPPCSTSEILAVTFKSANSQCVCLIGMKCTYFDVASGIS